MFVCEEKILDARYDDMLLRDSIVTDGAVVILQKMPVTASLTESGYNYASTSMFHSTGELLCLNGRQSARGIRDKKEHFSWTILCLFVCVLVHDTKSFVVLIND